MILLAQLAAAEGSSTLARLAEPWNSLYSDSKAVSSAVLFLHLVPLLFAGGAAITADRARQGRGSDPAARRPCPGARPGGRRARTLVRQRGIALPRRRGRVPRLA